MHADNAQFESADPELGEHRAARLEHRQVERREIHDLDLILHQQGIAVPADVARFELEPAFGMMAIGNALQAAASG